MSESLVLSGLTIYSETGVVENSEVHVNGGQIQAIQPSHTKTSFQFSNSYFLVPGFIDLHVHGANGVDVMDNSHHAFSVISETLAKEGVTGFLATTMTAPEQAIEAVLMTANDFLLDKNKSGAALLGVHLEGPFISPDKVGAQNKQYLSSFNQSWLERCQSLSNHIIKIVTLAPELAGATDFIRYLISQGIVASIGHSNATYEESLAAIEAGCTYITHLFNAMSGLHQREPGVVGAALNTSVIAELIADGVHVHPAVIDLTYNIKKANQLVLVTDAMRAKCLGDGCYDLGGQSVLVKNDIARLASGALAGSTLTMTDAIKNMIQFTRCSLEEALRMTSENPAKILRCFDRKGSIAVGKKADLVVLDEALNVVMTIVGGEVVYNSIESCTLS